MTTQENTNPETREEAGVEAQNATSPRPEVAPPGPSMSFEEALAQTLKQYDNALRELAK